MQDWMIPALLILVLLIFGSKRLPDMARSLGQSLRILRRESTTGETEEAAAAAAAAAAADPAGPTVPATPPVPPVPPVVRERPYPVTPATAIDARAYLAADPEVRPAGDARRLER